MLLSLDTETHLIRADNLLPRVVCVSLAWLASERSPVPGLPFKEFPSVWGQHNICAAILDRPSWGVLRDILQHEIAGVNLSFDLAVLDNEGICSKEDIWDGLDRGRFHDTSINAKLLGCAQGKMADRYGMARMMHDYFDINIGEEKGPDAWRMRYAELDGVPLDQWPEEAYYYPLRDAVRTLDIHLWQQEFFPNLVGGQMFREANGEIIGSKREMRAAYALHKMAANGLIGDAPRIIRQIQSWKYDIEVGIQAALKGGWLNADGSISQKTLREIVERANPDAPRTRPSKRFPGGQVKIGKDSLIALADAELTGAPEELRMFAESARAGKLYAVWGSALQVAAAGKMVSSPNHLVATGRTSWSKPPLQQPPRVGGVRECFIPRPGNVYINADYVTAELVALAQVCVWGGFGTAMADAINARRDLHIETARQLHFIQNGSLLTYEDAYKEYKADNKHWAELRQLSKAANFGFPGMMGPARFAETARKQTGLAVTVPLARALKAAWLRAFPEMRAYSEWVKRLTEYGTATVAQFVSGRVRGGLTICNCANGFFQGLVADIAKDATYRLVRAAEQASGPLAGCLPVLMLHDELMLEIPKERAEEGAQALVDLMESTASAYLWDVKMRVEAKISDRWRK